MKAFRVVACGIVLSILAGCGGSNPSVSGTVKIKGNGPVTKGNVFFDSGTYRVGGIIKPDGTYTLQGETAGAPPGSYKVYFTGTDEGDYTAPKPVINKKYADMNTSELKAEVKAGGGPINFELDPPG